MAASAHLRSARVSSTSHAEGTGRGAGILSRASRLAAAAILAFFPALLAAATRDAKPTAVVPIAAPTWARPYQAGLVAQVADAGGTATYTWALTGGTLNSGQGTRSIVFTSGAPGWTSISVTVTVGLSVDSGSARLRVELPVSLPLALATAAGAPLGDEDGTVAAARFAAPGGVVADGSGNVYVADTMNNRIRKIASDGSVSTVAGSGVQGFADGAAGVARFTKPSGVAIDGSGRLVVADRDNCRIRRIATDGTVSVVAGSGNCSFADGGASVAGFARPEGVSLDAAGNIYVADSAAQRIRKIAASDGTVSTFSGSGAQGFQDGAGTSAKFSTPTGVAVDGDGNVWVADSQNHRIRKVAADGSVTTPAGSGTPGWADGPGTSAQFSGPYGVSVASDGTVWVADLGNNRIRTVAGDGTVSTAAGDGQFGFVDGAAASARFAQPGGVSTGPGGAVYVADSMNNVVRIVASGAVATHAGAGPATSPWMVDGTGAAARLNRPWGVDADEAGVVYVADSMSHRIRKVMPGGATTVFSGAGGCGFADGAPTVARFCVPYGLAKDAAGNLYVADGGNNRIRKVAPDGSVTTLAGTGEGGFADGAGAAAKFWSPVGLAIDRDGVLYVGDMNNNRIRKVLPDGTTSTLAGSGASGWADGAGANAVFRKPWGVAVDLSGAVFVADTGNNRIRKVLPDGTTSTLAGSSVGLVDGVGTAARFWGPAGVALDVSGNLYVSDSANNAVRMVAPGGAVTTLAGDGLPGDTAGPGACARLRSPAGLAVGFDGRLWVADSQNHALRVGSAEGLSTAATIDSASGPTGQVRQLGATQATAATWAWRVVRRPPGSTASLSSDSILDPTFTPDAAGTFAFRLTATNGSLVSVSEVSLAAYVQGTATLSGSTTICAGQAAWLTLTLTGAPPWSVTWSDGRVDASVGTSPFTRTVWPTTTTVYTIAAASDANGPVLPSGSRTVTVSGVAPSADISAPAWASPLQAFLAATVPDAGAGATYAWTVTNGTATGGASGRILTFTAGASGNVRLDVTVTVPGGCFKIGTRFVRIGTPPAAKVTYGIFAGSAAGSGWTDGTGAAASFACPEQIAVDPSGNLFVVDSCNHTIRRVTPAGVVTTFAGWPGQTGAVDGKGGEARLNNSNGLARDAAGNLYVADSTNYLVRKVTPDGTVTTLAGAAGVSGSTDGPGATARFNFPYMVAVDAGGNVFVSDYSNHTIRRITPGGVVSTLAGLAGSPGSADGTGPDARFRNPVGVGVDASGNVYVADSGNRTVRRVTPSGGVTTVAGTAGSRGDADGVGVAARFQSPWGLTIDSTGLVWVSDPGSAVLRRIDPSTWQVTTPAGSPGVYGTSDGTGASALFLSPAALGTGAGGTVFVSDDMANTLRSVSAGGTVTTLVGTPAEVGSANGTGTAARFFLPAGVAVDGSGSVFVADQQNSTIRKILAATGEVSTYAGQTGVYSSIDGEAASAAFQYPSGVAVDPSGAVWVADAFNYTIRKIAAGTVSTVAGWAGFRGTTDGTGTAARFHLPWGIAADLAGNVFVSERQAHLIRRITPAGVVTTVAGKAMTAGSADGIGGSALFNGPWALAVDVSGYVFIADSGNNTIRRLAPDGTVTTVAGQAGQYGTVDGVGAAARLAFPISLHFDVEGNLWIAEREGAIRRMAPDGTVTTVAGRAGHDAQAPGTNTEARFVRPQGIAVDAQGSVWVVSNAGSVLVRGIPGLADQATIDAPTGAVGQARTLGSSPQTAVSWSWQLLRRPTGSTAELSSTSLASPTFTPDVADEYQFRLTATDGVGRTGITTVRLTAFVAPAATVSGGGTVCPGASAQVSAALTGKPPWSVTWSDGTTQSGLAASPATRTVAPASTTTYTVTALTDANGAGSSNGSATVTVSPAPGTPTPTNDGPKCEGGTVQLTVGIVSGATYAWTGPGGFSSTEALPTLSNVTAAMAGDYAVTVSLGSCASPPGTTTVVVDPKPATPVLTAPDTVLSSRAGYSASVPALPGATYAWTISNGTITSGGSTEAITFASGSSGPLELGVTVTSGAGCASPKGSKTVTVLPVGLYALTPCRVIDTRGVSAPALSAQETRAVNVVGGGCGIPATAKALVLNLTAVTPAAAGFLTLFPGDQAKPVVSNINFRLGQIKANNAIVPIGADGTLGIFNGSAGPANVLVDVTGYFQ